MQIEKLYQMLVEAGFQDSQVPWIASMLKNYVLGFVAEEARFVSHASNSDTAPEQLIEQYNLFYSSLSQEQFPNMNRLASYTTNTDWQQEFHFGLGVIIDGLSIKRIPPQY